MSHSGCGKLSGRGGRSLITGELGNVPVPGFVVRRRFWENAVERPAGFPTSSEKQVPPLRATIRFAARCAPVGMTIWGGTVVLRSGPIARNDPGFALRQLKSPTSRK
jgi:hypothetical protein